MSHPHASFDAASNRAGVIYMLSACAMFVLGDTCIKILGGALPLGQMIFLRGLIALPIVLVMAERTGDLYRLPDAVRNPRLIIRTIFEAGSTYLFLAALIRMTYADAIGIQQFVPLAVIAGAAVFLGDSIGWRRWLATLVGLIGVLIVVRPGTSAFSWISLLVLGSVLCVAGRDLITRRLGVTMPTLIIAIMSIGGVGLSALLLLPFESWRFPTLWEWLLLSIAALSSIGGFYWVAEALRRGEVATVMPFRYSLIPFGIVSGIVVFGDWPDRLTLLGSGIVLAAGLYALHRERVRAREQRT